MLKNAFCTGFLLLGTLIFLQSNSVWENRLAAQIRTIAPQKSQMCAARLAAIDEVVQEGLDRERMPGCVVLVGRSDGIVYHKAYGFRRLLPQTEPMQKDTVFDLASLTKPIATATSIHLLAERGKLSLDAKAVDYLPSFNGHGKEEITIQQLLTHTSGLLPDNALSDYQDGIEKSWERIDALTLRAEPGERFMYSDVGFIVLGRIVEEVSGNSLDQFVQTELFQPLGMSETGYLPAEELQARAAITQKRNEEWMQGEVHDPRAWELDGVAGHAGLFSTAEDLARFATMLLEKGKGPDGSVLAAETVQELSTPVEVPRGKRTPGWDNRSAYSSNRGDLFSPAAFGHGGFTGTSFWVDPEQDLYVIFLSNRVHPDGKGSVNALAGRIGTIAAAAIACP